MEILSVKNLTFTYNTSVNPALFDVSLSLKSGDIALLMGKSGCGKTTLLKLLKREIAPKGEISGEIFSLSKPLSELDDFESACKIGFVMQNADSQCVTDNVFSELCFGLENMGISADEIQRRVGEMANFLGIEKLMECETFTLSGGQKQLVNLCSVLVMRPEILILDEPTSTLDPVSAEKFLNTVIRLNRELGITVLISEHNSENIFSYADKILLMNEGKIVSDLSPEETVKRFYANEIWQKYFPTASQIWANSKQKSDKILFTIREGKSFLEQYYHENLTLNTENLSESETVLACKNLWFRYERESPDIIKDLDFELYKGEFFSVVGSNGCGKTTLIKALSGIVRCYKGKIMVLDKSVSSYKNGSLYKNLLAVLPQNPHDLFVKETVEEDFQFVLTALGTKDFSQIKKISEELCVTHLLKRHPYDLSGGEAQRCAIARILLSQPKIILMDEPVKALDNNAVQEVGELLISLKNRGISILCVTHNIEFAAQFSDRCAMFFDGQLCGTATPCEFFGNNTFYTTAASRISRNVFRNCVTVSKLNKLISQQEAENEKS